MAFEKKVLSIVVYGLYITCVTFIAFTIQARHAHRSIKTQQHKEPKQGLLSLTEVVLLYIKWLKTTVKETCTLSW